MAGKLTEDADVKLVTPARWRELYLREPLPSMSELGRRFGTHPATIRYYLLAAGISPRSRAEQNKIEINRGRKAKPPSWKGVSRGSQNGERLRALNLSRIGQRRPAASIQKFRQSMRTRFQIHCSWCGDPVWTVPHEYKEQPYQGCCRSHGALHRRFRERSGPNAPRPLIVDRLRELLRQEPYKALPLIYETVEKAGATIGAGEAEIIEVLMEISR